MKKTVYLVIIIFGVNFLFFNQFFKRENYCLAPTSSTKEVNSSLYKAKYLKYYSKASFNWHVYGSHVERVFDLASVYGQAYGLSPSKLKQLQKASILHDLCLPENFHLSFPFNDFVSKLPNEQKKKIMWYHREGVFSQEDYAQQMKTTIDVFEKYGFYDYIRKQESYDYEVIKGVFSKTSTGLRKYENYSDKDLRQATLTNLSRINQFSTMTGIRYMKDLGLVLTPLEEALIRFHHTAPKHITVENLKLAFPHKLYFSNKPVSGYNDEIVKLHNNIQTMLPILVLADTTEASNDGFRVESGFYKRDTETLEFWFTFMKNNLIDKTGELNDDMYRLAFDLIKTKNAKLFKVLNSSRKTRMNSPNLLPNAQDDFFIENMDAFSLSLYNPTYFSANTKKPDNEKFLRVSA